MNNDSSRSMRGGPEPTTASSASNNLKTATNAKNVGGSSGVSSGTTTTTTTTPPKSSSAKFGTSSRGFVRMFRGIMPAVQQKVVTRFSMFLAAEMAIQTVRNTTSSLSESQVRHEYVCLNFDIVF